MNAPSAEAMDAADAATEQTVIEPEQEPEAPPHPDPHREVEVEPVVKPEDAATAEVKAEAGEAEAVKTSEAANASEAAQIEGFEGWTIYMIRDFVSCMDTTRKKFSQLKERDPTGTQVKTNVESRFC
jgi:hypothetical protein